MALTKRQKQVLDFIAEFVDENGYCPSYEEIARGLELASLATVHKHISVLEGKSYLKRGFNQSRSLELTPKYVQEQRRPKAAVIGDPAARPHRRRSAGGIRRAAGGPQFLGLRRQWQHFRPGGPRELHDRRPHLRRRPDPAGEGPSRRATAISWWRW